jgi:hypothetical protein
MHSDVEGLLICPEILEFCGEQGLLSARVTAIQMQQMRDGVSLDLCGNIVFQFNPNNIIVHITLSFGSLSTPPRS